MIQWNKVTWYSQISAIILAVVIFCSGFYFGSKQNDSNAYVILVNEETNKAPPLELPLVYFDYSNLRSGIAGGKYPNWQSAKFVNGYRSFPTTTILFKDYSNKISPLPKLPNEVEWKELVDENITAFADLYREQEEDLGDLGKRFSTLSMQVSGIEGDVTGDGKPEELLSMGDVGGNHQPYYYKIIQGDRIIFEAGEGSSQLAGIYPDQTGNGFTLSWRADKHLTEGLCCALGNYSTRFIYKNGIFQPLHEQEELYYEVNNSEYKKE